MPAHGDQHVHARGENPFVENRPVPTGYTTAEIATLSSRLDKQLGPEYISSRPGANGGKVHYLSADKCINLANEVFGFNGWSSSIQQIQIDFIDENQTTGKVSLGLSVIMRVTLRDGTFHEDVGYGHIENCKGKAPAFEKAKKEGTTDALKRALRNFGNLLGNCIYDKEYVSRVTKLRSIPSKWEPENLHRQRNFENSTSNTAKDSRDGTQHQKANVHGHVLEDEFGSDDFDEVDFSVAQEEVPDGVLLASVPQERKFTSHPLTEERSKTNCQDSTNTQILSRTEQVSGLQDNPNPSGRDNESAPPASDNVLHDARKAMQAKGSTIIPEMPTAPFMQNKSNSPASNGLPDPAFGSASHSPMLKTSAQFFTARDAEILQQSKGHDPSLPLFKVNSDSPSIRKTVGFDHGISKPVARDQVRGVPLTTSARSQGLINPQNNRMRKIGKPGSAVQGSVALDQMTHSAGVEKGHRPALDDVTATSVNLAHCAMPDAKRLKTEEVRLLH